jgi:hypothetical protein
MVSLRPAASIRFSAFQGPACPTGGVAARCRLARSAPREPHLSSLPPTITYVGSIEAFRDETTTCNGYATTFSIGRSAYATARLRRHRGVGAGGRWSRRGSAPARPPPERSTRVTRSTLQPSRSPRSAIRRDTRVSVRARVDPAEARSPSARRGPPEGCVVAARRSERAEETRALGPRTVPCECALPSRRPPRDEPIVAPARYPSPRPRRLIMTGDEPESRSRSQPTDVSAGRAVGV